MYSNAVLHFVMDSAEMNDKHFFNLDNNDTKIVNQ